MRAPVRPTHQIDLLIGFTGAFAALFLVITVICEFTGQPALGYALVLLALVIVVTVLARRRSRIIRRFEETGDSPDF